MKLFSALIALFAFASIGSASDCAQPIVVQRIQAVEVQPVYVQRIVQPVYVQQQVQAVQVQRQVIVQQQRVIQRPIVQRSFSFQRTVIR